MEGVIEIPAIDNNEGPDCALVSVHSLTCITLRGWIKGKSRDTYLMYPGKMIPLICT